KINIKDIPLATKEHVNHQVKYKNLYNSRTNLFYKSNILRTGKSYKITEKDNILKDIDHRITDCEVYEKYCIDRQTIKLHYNICFFDIECDPDDSDIHRPYLVSFALNDDNIKSFWGPRCIKDMFDYLPHPTLLIAHNADYDFRFCINYIKFNIKNKKFIIKNNSFICGSFIYEYRDIITGQLKNKLIFIKDSYKLIPSALSEFPKMFKLDCGEKEAYPYTCYNINKGLFKNDFKITINEAKKHFKKHETNKIKIFEENLYKHKDKFINNDGTFNFKNYAIFYCEKDVQILKLGYNKYRNNVLEVGKDLLFPLDIDKISTIASLAHIFMMDNGCYEGVCRLKGSVRAYVQQNVVGGRVSTRFQSFYKIEDNKLYEQIKNNQIKCIREEKENFGIEDLDYNSLYPSAISTLSGLPIGAPKTITNENLKYEIISKYDWFVITIHITKVNQHRSISCLPFKSKEGKCIYDSKLLEDYTLVVNKIDLDELIKYHKIEYKIIGGLYWNEGFN